VFSSRLTFEVDTWLRQGGLAAASATLLEAISPSAVSPAAKRRRAATRRTLEQLRAMASLYAPYTSYAVWIQGYGSWVMGDGLWVTVRAVHLLRGVGPHRQSNHGCIHTPKDHQL